MRIDVPGADEWRLVSETLREALPFREPAVYVQAYLGFQHALYEASHGLSRLFSHKKTIAVVGSLEPAIDSIIVGFSEETYVIKQITPEDTEDVSTWLPVLQNELAFVLFVEDDPVTGEIFDHSKMHAALKEKRVFRVSVSHSSYREAAIARPMPFETRILSLRPDMAVLIAGERFRMTPVLASRLTWSQDVAKLAALELAVLAPETLEIRRANIAALEKNLPPGFKPYFADGQTRTSDRAVFYHEGMDGSAVIDELSRLSGATLATAGTESAMETPSPCRWNQPRFAEWLISRGINANIVRGLVIIDSELIGQVGAAKLASLLREASDNILRLQNG